MLWFILAAYAGATRRPLQTIVTLAIGAPAHGAEHVKKRRPLELRLNFRDNEKGYRRNGMDGERSESKLPPRKNTCNPINPVIF